MPSHTYMAAFDTADPTFDPVEVKAFLKADEDIDGWWHHIPGAYLIDTELSAGELSKRLKRHSGDTRFLVVEARLGGSNGWLPRQSWVWIRRRKRESSPHEEVRSEDRR